MQALPEVAAQRKLYLRLEQELLLSSEKNAPVTERKSIAVEIPITRPNHYICSDVRILVQAYVTSSVVQVFARLTLRKQFLFGRALDLVLYEGYVGRPHHPACPCGRLFCWRHTTSGGGDSETFQPASGAQPASARHVCARSLQRFFMCCPCCSCFCLRLHRIRNSNRNFRALITYTSLSKLPHTPFCSSAVVLLS